MKKSMFSYLFRAFFHSSIHAKSCLPGSWVYYGPDNMIELQKTIGVLKLRASAKQINTVVDDII